MYKLEFEKIGFWFFFISISSITLIFNNHTSSWGNIENIYYFYFASFAIFILFSSSLFLGQHNLELVINRVDLALIAYNLYILINVGLIKGVNFYNETHFTFLHLLMLYFVFKKLLRKMNNQVAVWLTVLGLISSCYGLFQLLDWVKINSTFFEITGFFSNPGPYGAYLASVLPFSLVYFLELKTSDKRLRVKLLKGILFLSLFVLLAGCLASSSRTAILSVTMGIIFLLNKKYFIFRRGWSLINDRKLLLSLFAISVLFIVFFLFTWKVDSSLGRLLIWKVSTNMFWNNPIFGIGSGMFGIDYANSQALYFAVNDKSTHFAQLAGMSYFAFNEWLQIGVELGFFGLLFFVTLIYFGLKTSKTSSIVLASKACIYTVIIQSFFFYPFNVLPIQLIFTFSLAVLSTNQNFHWTLRFSLWPRKTILFVLLLLGSFFLSLQYKTFRAVQDWKKAATMISFQEQRALSIYQNIYPRLNYRGEFLFNYGAELSKLGDYEKSVTILEEAKKKFSHIDLYMFLGNNYKEMNQFMKAEKNYIHASNMIPTRFYPNYLLVQLYRDTNQRKKAIKLARRILDTKPKVSSDIVDEIKNEMKKYLQNEARI